MRHAWSTGYASATPPGWMFRETLKSASQPAGPLWLCSDGNFWRMQAHVSKQASVTPACRRVPPGGSPFTRIYRVLAGAIAHRKAQPPARAEELNEVEGEMSIVPGQRKLERCVGAGGRRLRAGLC